MQCSVRSPASVAESDRRLIVGGLACIGCLGRWREAVSEPTGDDEVGAQNHHSLVEQRKAKAHRDAAALKTWSWRVPSQKRRPLSLGVFQAWLPITSSGAPVSQPRSAALSPGRAPLAIQCRRHSTRCFDLLEHLQTVQLASRHQESVGGDNNEHVWLPLRGKPTNCSNMWDNEKVSQNRDCCIVCSLQDYEGVAQWARWRTTRGRGRCLRGIGSPGP